MTFWPPGATTARRIRALSDRVHQLEADKADLTAQVDDLAERLAELEQTVVAIRLPPGLGRR